MAHYLFEKKVACTCRPTCMVTALLNDKFTICVPFLYPDFHPRIFCDAVKSALRKVTVDTSCT